jgi:hypothetical protein
MLADEKSVRTNASGQRTTIPTQLMAKLMLKVLDRLEYFLTKTTERADVAAERIARATPIMPFHVDEAIIKTILVWFLTGLLLVVYR